MTTLNLSWLDDFEALADSGNFSRAAEQRHMTQPAFGRRIRALEDWLGTPLFDRSGHPVTLTDAGQWFRDAAHQMLDRAAHLPEQARAIANGSAATLRFAATHALSLSVLPAWLRDLEARTSVGPIQLVSDVATHCETLLQQARVQFMLCHAHHAVPARLDAAEFQSISIGHDRLLPLSAPDRHGKACHRLHDSQAVAGRAHPLTPSPPSTQSPRSTRTASAAMPARNAPLVRRTAVPMLAYSAESGLGRVLRALHGPELDATADVVFTAHLATVLRSLAIEGRGLAFLPESLVAGDVADGRLVLAGSPRWTVALDVRLYRSALPLAPRAEAFWRAAGATAAGSVKPETRAVIDQPSYPSSPPTRATQRQSTGTARSVKARR